MTRVHHSLICAFSWGALNSGTKVSNTRPEETKIRQEDLTKILASVQSVHSKQENVDISLATLKRSVQPPRRWLGCATLDVDIQNGTA